MGCRHSRLIQWLVLFAVVHPGQHCPPQTFLLWSHRNRIRHKDAQSRTIHGAPLNDPALCRRGLGEHSRAAQTVLLSREAAGPGQALGYPADLIRNRDSAILCVTLGNLTPSI